MQLTLIYQTLVTSTTLLSVWSYKLQKVKTETSKNQVAVYENVAYCPKECGSGSKHHMTKNNAKQEPHNGYDGKLAENG